MLIHIYHLEFLNLSSHRNVKKKKLVALVIVRYWNTVHPGVLV